MLAKLGVSLQNFVQLGKVFFKIPGQSALPGNLHPVGVALAPQKVPKRAPIMAVKVRKIKRLPYSFVQLVIALTACSI